MRAVERYLLLQFIDCRWREHLYDMDYLREGIHLRGFAQIEPIVAYKNEAFKLFQDLMDTIWADFTRMVFNLEFEAVDEGEEGANTLRPERHRDASGRVSYSGGAGAGRARWRWRPPAARARSTTRTRTCARRSSSACSPRRSRLGATTLAGVGRARSSRSATAPELTRRVTLRSADGRCSRRP